MAEFAKVEHELEQKAGPLPVWAWSAILAGVAYLIYRHRMQKSAALSNVAGATVDPTDNTGTGTSDTATGSNNGFDTSAPIDDYLASNPTSAAYPVGSTAQGAPAPITNQQWANLASDYLLGKGDDPTLVNNAFVHYLAGTPLSSGEQAVINLAEQAFGIPPEGAVATKVAVTIPPGETATPVKVPPIKATPATPKFPNQVHRVGTPGQTIDLRSYIRQIYPNATVAQQNQIAFATIAYAPNEKYGIGSGKIPGGAEITFYSQAVK